MVRMGPESGQDRALGSVVGNRYAAAVKRQNALYNRQPQPESSGASAATPIQADEGIEYGLPCRHGNAGAVITDIDINTVW